MTERVCTPLRACIKLRDERGMTTVSMAVSIVLSLALIFASGQLYRIQSAAAEVQEVADAAALAAEAEVAEFMVAANTCDAAILSMTCLAGVLYGVGVVCACIPPTAELSVKVIDLAAKTVRARDSFAEQAADGLNQIQRMLPFLAAISATSVAHANDAGGAAQGNYFATAVLLPSSGEPIGRVSDGIADAGARVEDDIDVLREQAAKAEEAAVKANEAKLRGFQADCGDMPGPCMYERADHLSSVDAVHNPLYASVDAWSFRNALERAQYYFSERYDQEDSALSGASHQSVADAADSVLRRYYYDFAARECSRALQDSAGVGMQLLENPCVFPRLFRSLEEMRSTSLYTDRLFPVTIHDDAQTAHAWESCPAADGFGFHVSISQMEGASYSECDQCHFVISSFSSIGLATTHVANGFEYHYQKVRLACEEYNEAMKQLSPLKHEVQQKAKGLLEGLGTMLVEATTNRIHAKPPGRTGAISMVVNTRALSTSAGFESAFITGDHVLGTRAAVAGASLLGDTSESGASVITSLLDGFGEDGGMTVGAGRVALDCWSALLGAYEDGQAALTDGVRRALNVIPTTTASGLGDWAADALGTAFQAIGLEPVQLPALKPVLVNTAHVATGDDGQFAVRYVQVQREALAASSSATDLFSALAASARSNIDASGVAGDDITIAVLEFPAEDSRVPITLAIPADAAERGVSVVEDCIDALAGAAAQAADVRSWQ